MAPPPVEMKSMDSSKTSLEIAATVSPPPAIDFSFPSFVSFAAGSDPEMIGVSVQRAAQALEQAPDFLGFPLVFNLPAFLIVMVITWVLVIGIRESAWFNSAMVALKLAIIGFFVILGAFYVQPENWTPFAPNGFAGISSAAANSLPDGVSRQVPGAGDSARPARFNQLSPHDARFR